MGGYHVLVEKSRLVVIPGNISALIDTKGSGVLSINGVGFKCQKRS